MNIAAVRRIDFCAGHRVYGHESKCANLHGHNYTLYLHVQALHPGLDAIGRVIDFSVIKEKLGAWVDEYWDHRFLLWVHDEEAQAQLGPMLKDVYLLPENPTAENIGRHLLLEVGPTLLQPLGVQLVKVVVWETPNCFVEVSL